MPAEVRFYYMVPAQVVQRREACPVAYLPVGALEWHGSHLPFGTDCMTVEHMAIGAARKAGGVVFPPVVYGDCRYRLADHRPEWNPAFRRAMELDEGVATTFVYGTTQSKGYRKSRKKAFVPLPMGYEEQTAVFVRHVAYVMLEIATYGFRGIVLLPGHGPTTGICQKAIEVFADNVRCTGRFADVPKAEVFAYLVECRDVEPHLERLGVHADKLESSLIQVTEPGTVHPEKLPKSREKVPDAYLSAPQLHPDTGYSDEHRDLWDAMDAMDPREMSAEYGRKMLDAAVTKLAGRVREMKDSLGERGQSE